MLRTVSLSRATLRPPCQTLTSLCSNPTHPRSSSSCTSSTTSTTLPSTSNWVPSAPYSQSSKKDNEDPYEAVSICNRDPTSPPKLFVVQPRLRPDNYLQAKLNEALCLANSLEEQRDGYFDIDFFDKEIPPHIVVQNPGARGHKARADTYFGQGTVETVKCHLNAVESKDEVDAIFVNAILSGIQQRNLERTWGKPVLDRVSLIIEIFNAHAYTKEAKLQAELAALMYKKTRLVRIRGPEGRYTFGVAEEAEVVSARGRGSGGRGFISGAGETELQLQRRRILERWKHLLSQIEEVRRTRALQRAARKRHGGSNGDGLATIAVVGYTNAGKSTLVSALSDSDLYSDSRLFATVDPRLRSVVLPSGRKVLLSDTVGFISDLPVQLVEAFHATLEEVLEADLLVHVLDCTAPNLDEHRSTVLHVLQQIGVSEDKLKNMIEVWNKIDYQAEDTNVDEYLDDGSEDEASSLSGEEDNMASEVSSRIEENGVNKLSGQIVDVVTSNKASSGVLVDEEDADDSVPELSPGNLEAIDDQQGDYSDGWLALEEDDQDPWGDEDEQQSECSQGKDSIMEKDLHNIQGSGPHVKTSAIMGVGLQELLQLVDERLSERDEKLKSPKVGERESIFVRKWRPPCAEEAQSSC
ncbi:hypothetical protein FNV43_RR17375 [Rhamnella rubrinervis]|uniref:Hflx-type G domain-containing protein n=1 Tax=Rhamnella rubrinervis TaxID=2594499 RepID=A0A8K0DXE4_9ROSA|nr:hypothetical protein FNV43_RR17375 [Rhamnella rubrinervis]